MNNIVLHAGKVYEQQDVPFARVMVLQNVPDATNARPTLTIPKIPYELFRSVVAWQRSIAAKYNCESTTSLFLIDGKWEAVSFYQENHQNSMTADVDYVDNEKNKELLDKYADHSPVHATIHNHVKSGAGQSGRDAADEKNLPGPHITIGHLDRELIDWHARLSTMVNGKHQFFQLEFLDLIDVQIPDHPISDTCAKELTRAYLTIQSHENEIPDEWKDRFTKKEYTNQRHSSPSNTSSSQQNSVEAELLAHADNIAMWPYDFLSHLRLKSKKAFREDLNKLTALGQHAALAVAHHCAKDADNPTVDELYSFLRTRKKELATA